MTTYNDDEQRETPGWLMPAVVGLLLMLAAIVAVVLTIRPAAVEQSMPATPEAVVAAGSAESPGVVHGSVDPAGPAVQVISHTEARAYFDAGQAIFIDVRSGSAYGEGHIPGALTITSRELEDRLSALPEGAVIIAYGDAARPDSGQRGAQIFMEQGFPEVIALEGGFQAWRDAGHPVE